ncbi:HupE/UreJ family protein [Tepidimonas taiwanensis]|uniref:HupE / UreJ protein n=1 Tax=Tepidimonas taiwanensis TaxID=307486 RepID=A0A554X3T1_9BURK|nr:HupE/UreJ family protein [Tepidimonas taiwanensis]TSE30501.1 HupE / UreJ protein [Tepidimonas taiwanensis]UBQ06365.1 HupE/UreJ family protein [Tepidimonas taiwanensis]
MPEDHTHPSRRSVRRPPTTRVTALLLGLAAIPGYAHTGHGTSSWFEGLVHPFGLDHMLAMIAVGTWSVFALPPQRAWWGPAAFMLALIIGAITGWSVGVPGWLEHAVALSVVVFGLMLMAAQRRWPVPLGMGLIAAGAALHGLAHGAETPESGFAGYAAGFLLTTLALHMSGVTAGLSLRRWAAARARWLLAAAGGATGLAGLVLMGRLA